MAFERHHSALIVTSLITVAAFVGATVYTQVRLARVDTLSRTIETNSVPSIEHLSRAGVRLTRISQLIDDAATPGRERAGTLPVTRAEVAALQDEIARYSALTPLAGERDLWSALRTDVDRAVLLVCSALDAEERGTRTPAEVAADAELDAALDSALRAVVATLEFDVRQSESLARDVRRVHVTTLRMIVALDAIATVIALFGLAVAYRASRGHDRLLNEHNALLRARVDELDRFAGRVAHDVLSPLGTIATALPLLERACDARARPYVERSQRALQRVQHLVEGLLGFAQSGARPDPSSRCSLDTVLASIASDCSELAAAQGIDIVVDATSRVDVPCSVGVVTSVVQNLVRNAIKYMDERPTRKIRVRARTNGSIARIEVEDTGPGIPRDLQASIFEPFVRGPNNNHVPGTGLGLATVKRLAVAHGGAVGVESQPDAGSLFWVELPLAAASDRAGAVRV
jgi:signal transduction histidine kinase